VVVFERGLFGYSSPWSFSPSQVREFSRHPPPPFPPPFLFCSASVHYNAGPVLRLCACLNSLTTPGGLWRGGGGWGGGCGVASGFLFGAPPFLSLFTLSAMVADVFVSPFRPGRLLVSVSTFELSLFPFCFRCHGDGRRPMFPALVLMR